MQRTEAGGIARVPEGLSKSREGVMSDLEGWIESSPDRSVTHYDGCHAVHWRCMMEKAHEEIALLRLRVLRLTISGNPHDAYTIAPAKDPVRALRKHAHSLRGNGDPLGDEALRDALEAACDELVRHRSML